MLQLDEIMPPRAKTRPNPEICIVGAGPAGLTLALALGDAGFSIAVINRGSKPSSTKPDTDGRAYSIAHGCWKIWEALGVAEELSGYAQPIETITAEAAGGRPIIFSKNDLETAEGPLGYMIEAGQLNFTLRTKADAHALITILDEATVSGIETTPNSAHVQLEGVDAPIVCRLIVGCDGRNSTIRRLAGIRWFGHDYGSSSLVATVKLARGHDNTARQSFLKTGPFAALPLQNDRANLVWTQDSDVAETLCKMPEAEFSAELAAQLGDFLGEFMLDGPRFAYPLILRVAETLRGERTALVGDAGHSIHPLAGQGLNLGLKDVAVLAEKLVDADRAGLDQGAAMALDEYDALRRPDIISMAFGMDGFEKLFSAPSPIRTLAGAGMGFVGELDRVRSIFSGHASAVQHDAPRLMRGQPLGR